VVVLQVGWHDAEEAVVIQYSTSDREGGFKRMRARYRRDERANE